MPPFDALPPRRTGNANRGALCRKWATGCADNAGSIRCGLPVRQARNTLKTCGGQCRHGRSGNNASMRRGARTRHGCGLSLRHSRRNFRPWSMMPCRSASGCTFIPKTVRHLRTMFHQKMPWASSNFSRITNAAVRPPTTGCNGKRRCIAERMPEIRVVQWEKS